MTEGNQMREENRAPYNELGLSVSRTEINGEEVFLVTRIVSQHKTVEEAHAAANEFVRSMMGDADYKDK
jgi:hypothetical protein